MEVAQPGLFWPSESQEEEVQQAAAGPAQTAHVAHGRSTETCLLPNHFWCGNEDLTFQFSLCT